jgi:hypothetical protein
MMADLGINTVRTDTSPRTDVLDEAARHGLRLNPLYVAEPVGNRVPPRLRFPSPDYEEEFGACRQYLPDRWSSSVTRRPRSRRGACDLQPLPASR